MNKTRNTFESKAIARAMLAMLAMLAMGTTVHAQDAADGGTAMSEAAPAPRPASAAQRPSTAPAAAGAAGRQQGQAMAGLNCSQGVSPVSRPMELTIGKSRLLRLPNPVTYRTIGSPAVVQAMLVPPDGLYLLGARAGATNMIIQDKSGACQIIDVVVQADTQALSETFRTLMPNEKELRVAAAANSVVLSGTVEDATAVSRAVDIANAFMRRSSALGGSGSSLGGGNTIINTGASGSPPALQEQVINQLAVRAPQQVMLEVKVAEISKTLLDKLGSSTGINRSRGDGVDNFRLLSNFLTNSGGVLEAIRVGRTAITIDGQKEDGLVRVLAEPNIMAISGQNASFLSGGKIFIPVAQSSALGAPTITLEEKEFGIGVKFMPTVLAGTRINLKLVSEVSDLSQTGSPFTTLNGVTSVLPSLTVRRADTTIQLNDGQSFVIAGLIKNNFTEAVKRFPGLGETPVLGALFRSTEFQTDQTELAFVITPRLVKPLPEAPRLPTDNHTLPSRGDVYLNGSLEGTPAEPARPAASM